MKIGEYELIEVNELQYSFKAYQSVFGEYYSDPGILIIDNKVYYKKEDKIKIVAALLFDYTELEKKFYSQYFNSYVEDYRMKIPGVTKVDLIRDKDFTQISKDICNYLSINSDKIFDLDDFRVCSIRTIKKSQDLESNIYADLFTVYYKEGSVKVYEIIAYCLSLLHSDKIPKEGCGIPWSLENYEEFMRDISII